MTFSSLVAGLAAMTVTGVTRRYTEQPHQLGTADLPCMYPRLPEGNETVITLGESTGLLSAVCELAIVVNPYLQDRNSANFSLCLSLMDALNASLASNVHALNIDRWSIRQQAEIVNDTAYWLIVARVEASG